MPAPSPAPQTSGAHDEVEALHNLVLRSLDDDQAVEVVTIPLQGKSSIADHMVIASGRSTRQVASMAQKLTERIKQEVASAAITDEGNLVVGHAGGRDVTTGALIEREVSQAELAEALQDVVQQIVALVADALSHAGPEIASDIISHGFVLSGGGAMLRGMDVVLREATGLPVRVADDPRHCVAIGAARALTQGEYRTELHTASGGI